MRTYLEQIIVEAGHMARSYFEAGVVGMQKSHETDIVTEADKAVSAFLIEKIATQFPDHGIFSEESEGKYIHEQASVQWVIDPIDGTRNFAAGLPFWGVMIAIRVDGVTEHAGVYMPMTNELFVATRGAGAWCNGKQLHCSEKQSLQYAMGKMFVAQPTGVYGTHYPLFSRVFAQILSEYGVKMREFGASAVLCYVAQGSVDFAFGNSGLEWDYLPTFLICQEAGLTVTDSEGNPWQIGRQDYIIGNEPVHAQLLSYFKQ